MEEKDSKFVASARPVNLRTAHKTHFKQPVVPTIVKERVAAAKARNRFGPSLQDQLNVGGDVARASPLAPSTIAGILASAASAMALLLGWIQQSIPLAALGALGLCGGLLLTMRAIRSTQKTVQEGPTVDAIFSTEDVQKFDLMLEQLAGSMPDELAQQLLGIKQDMVRIIRKAEVSGVDENFTVEDRMYLIECVRRYLPDSLKSYLLVPAGQRATHFINGNQTAVSLLSSQLSLMSKELKTRDEKLTTSTASQLLRQQRFLESKASK